MGDIEPPDLDDLGKLAQDPFTRRVALMTALFASLLAVTSLGGNNASKDAMLSALETSNKWAHYQAKTQRESISRLNRQLLELREGGVGKGGIELLETLRAEEARYAVEKKELEAEALEVQARRDRAVKQDPYFDLAQVLLQLGIVLASVTILTSSRRIFKLGLGAAVIGTLLAVNGFTLIIPW